MCLNYCCRGFLKVPWTARWSNQSILKGINSEYSLEGLVLKLKFQYFDCLMQRAKSLEKTLMLGRRWGQEKRATEHEMVGLHYQLNGHVSEQTPGDGEDAAVHATSKSWTWLSDWTTTTKNSCYFFPFNCKFKTFKKVLFVEPSPMISVAVLGMLTKSYFKNAHLFSSLLFSISVFFWQL